MSLQHAANHLAAQGRGGDSTLVHMSPGEVKSLQQLAMAHGGSLSVNPNTGLPEAGFLSSILPTVIGAGLMAATGGAAAGIAPWMVGLGVGGVQTLRTGSLGKGLMAGLGAYGGAGLVSSLASSGAAGLAGQEAAAAFNPNTMATVGEGAPIAANAPEVMSLDKLQAMQPEATAQELARAQTAQQTALNSYNAQQEALNALKPETLGRSIADIRTSTPMPDLLKAGVQSASSAPGTFLSDNLRYAGAAATPVIAGLGAQGLPPIQKGGPNPYQYSYSANTTTPFPQPDVPDVAGLGQAFSRENRFFTPVYTRMAGGGPVEAMSDANAVGANTGYPMADIQRGAYATPYQQPISQNVLSGAQDTRVDPYTGQERLAKGGLSHLGDYSDGGRLLRGPGDGVSDSIPAVIGNKQPARLADGEFVVPARIVSELGNGSTEAGARKLYAMMDRVQKARGKTTGKGKVAKNTKADKYLPA